MPAEMLTKPEQRVSPHATVPIEDADLEAAMVVDEWAAEIAQELEQE